MRMRWRLVLALSMFAAPQMASAQDADRIENGTICTAIAQRWSGTLDETRHILTQPVAPSFRNTIDGGGCARFQLVKQDLIKWHIAFGDQRSTTAALAYLERELLQGFPEPALYRRELERAWRAAQPDLGRLRELRAAPGADQSAAHRLAEQSPAIRRLETLAEADFPYRLIAHAYLDSAEEFGAFPLLDDADRFIRALEERRRFAARLGDERAASGEVSFDDQPDHVPDLRMRSAVLRAHLTRSDDDVQNALSLVEAEARPIYRPAAEIAFSRGDFCDIDPDRRDGQAVEQACREDDYLQERVVGYWLNRARLDLVTGTPPGGSDTLALRLVEQEQTSSRSRCCWADSREDELRLRLMIADRHTRAFASPETGSRWARFEHWRDALDEFERAAHLVPPVEAPARFRRIAERWLALWARAGEAEPYADSPSAVSPRLHRYAAYLRTILNGLDSVATGAETVAR